MAQTLFDKKALDEKIDKQSQMPNTVQVHIKVDAPALVYCDGDLLSELNNSVPKIFWIPLGKHHFAFVSNECSEIRIDVERDFFDSSIREVVEVNNLRKAIANKRAKEARKRRLLKLKPLFGLMAVILLLAAVIVFISTRPRLKFGDNETEIVLKGSDSHNDYHIKSNRDYSCETDSQWLSVEKHGDIVSINVTRNDTGEERNAIVVFKYANKAKSVSIKQINLCSVLELEQTSISIPADKGRQYVTLKSDVQEISVISNSSWCNAAFSKGMILLEWQENDSEDRRIAEIIINADEFSQKLIIEQSGIEKTENESISSILSSAVSSAQTIIDETINQGKEVISSAAGNIASQSSNDNKTNAEEHTDLSSAKVSISKISVKDYDSVLEDAYGIQNVPIVGFGLKCKLSIKNLNSKNCYIEWLLFDSNENPIPGKYEGFIIDKQTGISKLIDTDPASQEIHMIAPIGLFSDFSKGFHSFKYIVRIVVRGENDKKTILATSRMSRQTFLSDGQGVEIESIRLEQPVKCNDKKGKAINGTGVHIKFTAKHMQGLGLNMICWILDDDGQYVPCSYSDYTDQNGNMCSYEVIEELPYDYTTYDDFIIFIPNYVLASNKAAKYAVIYVWDMYRSKHIYQSDKISL